MSDSDQVYIPNSPDQLMSDYCQLIIPNNLPRTSHCFLLFYYWHIYKQFLFQLGLQDV